MGFVYEWKCKECGKITENNQQESTKKNPVVCSHCKSTDINRKFSCNFQFKGFGFYHTDSGKVPPNDGYYEFIDRK